jgi:diguanylate cyclase (GGDEF)-like protein
LLQDFVHEKKNLLVWRTAGHLVAFVALSIMIMAGLGYWKLFQVTQENSSIRIDRAARAASAILARSGPDEFTIARDETGHPLFISIRADQAEKLLQYRPEMDALLAEIGLVNQGAANLFRYQPSEKAFVRFATTFRNRDGTAAPAVLLERGHPAFDDLVSGVSYVGEVPVMGRMRLAYLMPIKLEDGSIAGALAVDVGWVDDLVAARSNLRNLLFGFAVVLLVLVGAGGIFIMRRLMRPLGAMARFANALASGDTHGEVPYVNRGDEVGALAQGLSRVVDLQEDLEKLAYFDTLTGCGNRARYFCDLEHTSAQARTEKSNLAIIHLDLVRFAKVNDAHGQAAGDQALMHMAAQIRRVFSKDAFVSRLAADKFCVIVRQGTDIRTIGKKCAELVRQLAQPLVFHTCELHLDCRIGVALFPADGETTEIVHRNATLALKFAKTSSVENVVLFSKELLENDQRQLELESMLRVALDTGQLEVHYQPQICPLTHKLSGLEALVRWNHPTKGYIAPAEFIPVAEKTGLITELGSWVLDESCRQARSWLNEGLDFGHVSVNVSPIQLWQTNFVQFVQICLEAHGLRGKYLCLEITESVFIDDDESCIRNILDQLRARNISISLDDFGSGYASLGYLSRLPFDQLKIDRQFVTNVHGDAEKAKLLASMVGLGKGLGLRVVGEGVELAEEVRFLASAGCDTIQGYYFSKAVAPGELPCVLARINQMARSGICEQDIQALRLVTSR